MAAWLRYVQRIMHTVCALLYLFVVIHWSFTPISFRITSPALGNQMIVPVPVKQSWIVSVNGAYESTELSTQPKHNKGQTKLCDYSDYYRNSSVRSGFPTQRASTAVRVSMSSRHHDIVWYVRQKLYRPRLHTKITRLFNQVCFRPGTNNWVLNRSCTESYHEIRQPISTMSGK